MRIRSVVAMVPVSDMPRSLAFWQKLGFDVENDFVPPGETVPTWAWLDGGGGMVMLHCADAPLPVGPRPTFYVYVPDVGEAHGELPQRGVPVGEMQRPFYAPQGEFRVVDPDGYVLVVSQL